MKGMPVISRCDEADCFYNHETACHAPAINVGGPDPKCDTFARSTKHIGRRSGGVVGACHVAECRHNTDLTCGARAITVGPHHDHPDCLTFELAK